MNRKGITTEDSLYFTIAFVLIGAGIMAMFVVVLPKMMIGSYEGVMAKDIGLSVMTISASPYDMLYSYDKNTEKYIIKISEKKIQVNSEEGSGSYNYVPMEGVTVKDSIVSNVLSMPMSLENSVLKFSSEYVDFSDACSAIPLTIEKEYLNLKIVVPDTETGENLNNLNQIKVGISLRTSEVNSPIKITENNEDLTLVLKTSENNPVIKYYTDAANTETFWNYRFACYIHEELKTKHSTVLTNLDLQMQSTKDTITIDFGNVLSGQPPALNPQETAGEIYSSIKSGLMD